MGRVVEFDWTISLRSIERDDGRALFCVMSMMMGAIGPWHRVSYTYRVNEGGKKSKRNMCVSLLSIFSPKAEEKSLWIGPAMIISNFYRT